MIMTTPFDNIEPRGIPGDALWAVNSAKPMMRNNTALVTASSAIVALGETIYHVTKENFSTTRLKKIWKPVAQNAAAVPVWDLAQKAGYSLTTGAAKGLVASSLLVGICAGPAAFLAGYIYELATDKTTREMWCQNSSLMGKKFIKDLGLSATIGAIPNAIWNVAFVLSLFSLLSLGCPPVAAVLLTAVIVALAVAYCNVQFGEKAMEVADSFINEQITRIWNQNLKEEYNQLRAQLEPKYVSNLIYRNLSFSSSKVS